MRAKCSSPVGRRPASKTMTEKTSNARLQPGGNGSNFSLYLFPRQKGGPTITKVEKFLRIVKILSVFEAEPGGCGRSIGMFGLGVLFVELSTGRPVVRVGLGVDRLLL